MTKSTAISLLLLSSLAVTAQSAATFGAQPGRHAPPYLASKLGNHKRSGRAWLDRVMGASPQTPSADDAEAANAVLEESAPYKRSSQAWSDRVMEGNPQTPSVPGPSGSSSSQRGYYGEAYGLTPPRPLQLTDVTDSASRKRGEAKLSSDWSYVGCVEESDKTRLLNGFGFSSSLQNSVTVCTAICGQMGYEYAGAEYGHECYCGNEYTGNGGERFADSDCAMPCPGDSSQSCGAGWRIAMYKRTAGASTSGTGSATASATTSGSGSTVTGGLGANSTIPAISGSITATASQTAGMNHTVIANQTASATHVMSASQTASATTSAPGPIYTDITDSSEWYSLGCAIDEGGRVLTDFYVAQDDMAIDLCLDICEDKGYKYAGLENGNECMCGNALKQGVSYTASEWDCWMPCAGDATETCGAGWRLMTYELATGIDYCEDTISSSLASSTSARTSLIVNNHAASTKAASPSNASTIASASASIKPSASVSSAAISKTSTAAASTATGAVVKGSTAIPSSSADHEVFAHHMVGNTYPYVQSTWATDIKLAKAASIDGFALNMGSDWWQPLRVNDAYAAAEAAGDFTMFLSLDMTSLSCSSYTDGIVLASLVKAHASSPAQAMWNGKVLVSTFSGENCYFGQGSVSDGWNNVFIGLLKSSGIDIFFVPSVFSDPSSFSAATWMDGELNWNGGWPMDGSDITTSSDATYMNALGSKEYMAAISPAFFTHFPVNGWNKNWIYRGDNWLYSKRWEDVIAMRDRVKMVEILTWNDYGEASYIGPIDGALPSGSEAWTNGFPHTAWLQLTKYYAQAFKTGSWPTITSDSIVVWARPHPKAATASNDSTGRPSGWDRTDDDMYALVFATDSGTVTLTAGSNTQTYPVTKGVNKLKLASSPGSMSAKLVRNGQTVTSYDAGSAYTYTLTPTTYNFNYFVGSSS